MQTCKFELDSRLQNDCISLGELQLSRLLLMNNALLPWFVLVPRVAVEEIYQLERKEQQYLLEEVNAVSAFVHSNFKADKLNIAAIGNIVKQLHIHIVARKKTDCCWPGVVWGTEQRVAYDIAGLDNVRLQVQQYLGLQIVG